MAPEKLEPCVDVIKDVVIEAVLDLAMKAGKPVGSPAHQPCFQINLYGCLCMYMHRTELVLLACLIEAILEILEYKPLNATSSCLVSFPFSGAVLTSTACSLSTTSSVLFMCAQLAVLVSPQIASLFFSPGVTHTLWNRRDCPWVDKQGVLSVRAYPWVDLYCTHASL